MAQTKQIGIDTSNNKAVVITMNDGIPVPPAKELDINSLNANDKKTVEDAITIIQNNAK